MIVKNFCSLTIFTFKLVYAEIFWFSGIYSVFSVLQRLLLLHQNNHAAVFFNDIFFLYVITFLLYGNLAEKIKRDSIFDWLRSINLSGNQILVALDICVLLASVVPLCTLISVFHIEVNDAFSINNSLPLILLLGLNFLVISHLCQGGLAQSSYIKLLVIPLPILLPSLIFSQIHYEEPSTTTLCYVFSTTVISIGILILSVLNTKPS